MEVELPNGVVLLDVPEGATKNQIMNKAVRAGLAKYTDFIHTDAAEGLSGTQKFLAGTGRGLVRTLRGAGNLVGLVDDKTITDADERDADLLRTGAGATGNFVGEVAATAPVGGAAGGLTRAMAARIAARGAPRAAAMLGGRVAQAAAEGAASGAVLADPGERAQGARTGALLGGGLGAAVSMFGTGAKAVTPGLPRSERGQAALDSGIPLTPGMAANEGSHIPRIEAMMAKMPGLVGRRTRAMRQRADEVADRTENANLYELLDEPAASPSPASVHNKLSELVLTSMNPKGLLLGVGMTSEMARRFLTGYYKDKPAEFARVLRRLGISTSSVTRGAVAGAIDDDDSD